MRTGVILMHSHCAPSTKTHTSEAGCSGWPLVGCLARQCQANLPQHHLAPGMGCIYRCRSKGYGFASFYTRADAENALAELSGADIGSRAVRCGWAHHKKDAMQSIDYATVDQV